MSTFLTLTTTTVTNINLDDFAPVLSIDQLKAGDTVLYISSVKESCPVQYDYSLGTVESLEQGRGGLYVVLADQKGRANFYGMTQIRAVKRA